MKLVRWLNIKLPWKNFSLGILVGKEITIRRCFTIYVLSRRNHRVICHNIRLHCFQSKLCKRTHLKLFDKWADYGCLPPSSEVLHAHQTCHKCLFNLWLTYQLQNRLKHELMVSILFLLIVVRHFAHLWLKNKTLWRSCSLLKRF